MSTDRPMESDEIEDMEELHKQILKGIRSNSIKGKHVALLKAKDIVKGMKNDR